MTTQLESPRLLLRQWLPSDLPAIAAVMADPEVRRYLGDGHPYSHDESRAWMEARTAKLERDGIGAWAAELKATGVLVGWAELGAADWIPELMPAIEVGWGLARPYWGRGLATEAGSACLSYGFDKLGLDRVIAIYHPANAASGRVMERLGMSWVRDVRHPRWDLPRRVHEITRREWTERRREQSRGVVDRLDTGSPTRSNWQGRRGEGR